MTVAERDDDRVKQAATKPAKHRGRKAGRKRGKQKPGTKSVPIAKPAPVIHIADEAIDNASAEHIDTEAIDDTPAEHIDTSAPVSEEETSQATDTPVITSDDTEIAVPEAEQPAPALKEELQASNEMPATEIASPAVPVEPELHGTAVAIATLPPPETPQPEFDASAATDEEESVSIDEISLPDTPFAAQPDTPRPDDTDENAPVNGLAPIDAEVSVDTEIPDVTIETTPDISSSLTETEAVTPVPAQIPVEKAAPAPLEKRPLARRFTGRRRIVMVLALLIVFLTSSLLFWQDISAAHLYISNLNLSNGAILAREDSGSGYSGDAVIAPVAGQSTVFFGVAGNQLASSVQQVIELQRNGAAQTNQFNAPLAHGTLSVTQQGNLVIESEHGLEVTTPGGQLLWRVTGDQPARGAHAFQPAFDSDTLYTVKSAAAGQIAAYGLQRGVLRWTMHLNDTFNYAPPFLLDGTTLYVAGDYAIFALNSSNGSLLWTAPYAARTLLLSGTHHLLIAASADGLLALNTSDGSPLWTFYGQAGKMTAEGVLSLTPAQFYQASATDTTIFATGIAWQAPQIQPELRLYALDTATGRLRWSRQLASSTLSADAGRVFTPLADSAHHLVLLEQQIDSNTLAVAAYDASNGQPRWQTLFQHASAASPSLLTSSNNTLLFITIQTDRGTALSVITLARLLLLAMILLSILGLLLLFPRHSQRRRYLMAQQQVTSAWKAVRAKRSARNVSAIALLVILIVVGSGVVGYAQLNQARENISLLDMHTGATRWQQAIPTSTEALAAGEQGSILSVVEQANMRRVQAIYTDGTLRWQTFASAGTFSIPAVPTQPGTLLLALNGHIPLHNTFAPADPAYPPPPDSLFILSLLNRDTGQSLWQSAIVNPGDQQSAVVLGADNHFIYVASLQTNAPGSGAAMQLLAVDQTSGQISWRVSGPLEPPTTPRDNGTLLLQGRQIIWQVEDSVYAIDSLMGQIAWRRSFGSDSAHTREEGQMAETSNLLLVARSQSIYAIDPISGNQLWTIPVPGPYTPQSTSGLSLNGNTLLLYGNGQVEAIDLANRHRIWARTLPASIHILKVAVSGKHIYIALDNSGAPGQMLMALDSRTGSTLWSFQPAEQASFNNNIIEEQGILLATLCAPEIGAQSCGRENLYALNTTTGAVNWQISAASITNISISPDGSTILLQRAGSIL